MRAIRCVLATQTRARCALVFRRWRKGKDSRSTWRQAQPSRCYPEVDCGWKTGSVARLEAVSDPRLGDDVVCSVLVGFELLAQVSHKDAQVFRLLYIVLAPDSP